ncbi:hypothetical protein F442_09778 [Phytophthora nicotianae P10297]|uniref:Uncharacterized protein n=5 Tax=Phytophthora nicotianae TaxID=4792 RepID=W2PAR3_PHYN3|nr:hypothetical protein PPTG_24788 [Phytophthora nicotianae INRA-310]ETI45628.1 hypothetical protein F443_09874 [Phytophthora nicotianae P1569]ETL92128.1 hypothetical protein L917_09501 [Phytophthora nicotianae]ETO66901.1 hypothetical protein F444_16041 [Phytophthora nicotianae P1976]ETP43509.1 hypothetical protein F442_09778 [Phytophthora nicotianae P10297]ETM45427.1 hypothetical protein L914_09540 [Phytophthora nicotianae]
MITVNYTTEDLKSAPFVGKTSGYSVTFLLWTISFFYQLCDACALFLAQTT